MVFLFAYLCFTLITLYLGKQFIKGGINRGQATDIKDKVIGITGASSGLGKYTAIELLNKGAKVIFACRSKERFDNAIQEVNAIYRCNAVFIRGDLCDFESIISFTKEIKEKYPVIDFLYNNAGAQPDTFALTKDGFDTFFQGNYLGVVLLSLLLGDNITNKGRIVNVSSMGHYFSGGSVDDFEATNFFANIERIKRKYYTDVTGKFNLYFTSKLMIIYFTKYLRLICKEKQKDIKIVSLHPGIVNTEFMRFLSGYPLFGKVFNILNPLWVFISKTVEQGAQSYGYLAYAPYHMIKSGKYYADCKVCSTSNKAENEEGYNKIIEHTLVCIKKYIEN